MRQGVTLFKEKTPALLLRNPPRLNARTLGVKILHAPAGAFAERVGALCAHDPHAAALQDTGGSADAGAASTRHGSGGR